MENNKSEEDFKAVATQIFFKDGLLSFDVSGFDGSDSVLATKEQYELADRCVGSVFESLNEGEKVSLNEGVFELDEDLDLV
jgi:hypothetical protein